MENQAILEKAALMARGLAMDAVAECKSGHLGLPLGAADIGAVLFGNQLNYNPADPQWLNRDRFVLSAGHGSMFLYAWLHLSGYDLPIEEVQAFRKLHSKTPGHPEFHETPGVECTTGPLGQGVGNAVGMAMAAKRAGALFNTAKHTIIDHNIVVLCGDGCLQEGVANEAIALAGHLGLDNLIIFYDSNDVTLDAMADKTQSGDMQKRLESYNFDVQVINGHDYEAIEKAYVTAKNQKNSRPKFIIAKTIIGKGISEVEHTSKAHGEAGAHFVDASKKKLGLPETKFFVSEDVQAFFAKHKEALVHKYNTWQQNFKEWQKENPELAKTLDMGVNRDFKVDIVNDIPAFPSDAKLATRDAGGTILNAIAAKSTLVMSGSADLHGSTKNYIKDAGDFSKENRIGRNILFGIREHAMGAIINGIGYYGIFNASGATFLVFSDYLRPSIRLAALSKLPIMHIFTHDSVGVGEDGPTHQPVETVSALRLIPGLDVIRPADPEETAGAFACAINKTDGPSLLILSRQALPLMTHLSVEERRKGVEKGGYIAFKEVGELQAIILSTGSELQHALKAAAAIGSGVRVVSMPCFERFERQSAEYKEQILPASCRKRIAIEAGVSALWYKYVGLDGKIIGIDRFGISAPGNIVFEELGITAKKVQEAFEAILSQDAIEA